MIYEKVTSNSPNHANRLEKFYPVVLRATFIILILGSFTNCKKKSQPAPISAPTIAPPPCNSFTKFKDLTWQQIDNGQNNDQIKFTSNGEYWNMRTKAGTYTEKCDTLFVETTGHFTPYYVIVSVNDSIMQIKHKIQYEPISGVMVYKKLPS